MKTVCLLENSMLITITTLISMAVPCKIFYVQFIPTKTLKTGLVMVK